MNIDPTVGALYFEQVFPSSNYFYVDYPEKDPELRHLTELISDIKTYSRVSMGGHFNNCFSYTTPQIDPKHFRFFKEHTTQCKVITDGKARRNLSKKEKDHLRNILNKHKYAWGVADVNMTSDLAYLLPEHDLIYNAKLSVEFIKENINLILNRNPKTPRSYYEETLKNASWFLARIAHNDLNLKRGWSNCEYPLNGTKVKYSLWGHPSRRLTHKKGSFPAMSLPKKYRHFLQPSPGYKLVNFDFESMELRLFLEMTGEDPNEWEGRLEDLHGFNKGIMSLKSREKAKKVFYAWLYDSSDPEVTKYDSILGKFYNKKKLLDYYYDNNGVITSYSGIVTDNVSKHHAVNRILQSTAADAFVQTLAAVESDLQSISINARPLLCIHDSITFEVKHGERFDDYVSFLKESMEYSLSGNYAHFFESPRLTWRFPVKVEVLEGNWK